LTNCHCFCLLSFECCAHFARKGCQGFAHATCFILQHRHICTHCQSIHASATLVHLASPSQSWNFAPSPHTPPSSYLAEIHGLALAYLATPPHLHNTHTDLTTRPCSHYTTHCGNQFSQINSHHHGSHRLTYTEQLFVIIRHLLQCMKTRAQSLKLRHILSHMEHTYTDDAELIILRDRLAEADTIP
jgi:hypothetical protein